MKVCIKCKEKHNGSFGSGKFCSRQCANSRSWTEADKLKKSTSVKNSAKRKEYTSRRQSDKLLTRQIYDRIVATKKKNRESWLLKVEPSELNIWQLREYVIVHQDNKCNKCGVEQWMGKALPLELDHKDGNNQNNSIENLEALCPNCHATTDTWRGRNKKSVRKKISDLTLLEALLVNDWNVRQSLLQLGFAAKGGNYKRCYKLKREYFENLRPEALR